MGPEFSIIFSHYDDITDIIKLRSGNISESFLLDTFKKKALIRFGALYLDHVLMMGQSMEAFTFFLIVLELRLWVK